MNRVLFTVAAAVLLAALPGGCSTEHRVSGTQRHDVHHTHDDQRIDVHIHRDGKTRRQH